MLLIIVLGMGVFCVFLVFLIIEFVFFYKVICVEMDRLYCDVLVVENGIDKDI